MADQVTTMEPDLNLCFCRILFTCNKYSEYLAFLEICIHETVGLQSVNNYIGLLFLCRGLPGVCAHSAMNKIKDNE